MGKRFAVGALLILIGAVFGICPAIAGERHFGYTYETDVLPDGGRELESYSTFRFGRDGEFYSALDQRLEFEMGLGDGIQASWYFNFTQELEGPVGETPTASPFFDGVSNEWIFKLSDAVVDPLGFGLYAEAEYKPDEVELETKVLVDKQMGDFKWAFNFIAEPEYHWIDNTSAFNLIPTLGAGYFFSPRFMVGMETQIWNGFDQSFRQTSSIFSLGPVVAFSGKDWWFTVTALPQIANWMGGGLDFSNTDTNSQRWQIRADTSFSI
jgi:hypothetical protein